MTSIIGHAILRCALVTSAAILIAAGFAGPSMALSEIKREELPKIETVEPETPKDDAGQIPIPDEPSLDTGDTVQPDNEEDPDGGGNEPADTLESDLPLPDVQTDLSLLPAPALRMRELILEASYTGDVEALRPLIGTGAAITQLSLGGIEGDPVNFLREISGDGEGHEILAILQEVLEAGYVHMDAGTPHEIYVWPYFFAYPLDRLDDQQRVELFRIVTAGDYEDMRLFGGYNFYRVGITPEGQWAFFVAGD